MPTSGKCCRPLVPSALTTVISDSSTCTLLPEGLKPLGGCSPSDLAYKSSNLRQVTKWTVGSHQKSQAQTRRRRSPDQSLKWKAKKKMTSLATGAGPLSARMRLDPGRFISAEPIGNAVHLAGIVQRSAAGASIQTMKMFKRRWPLLPLATSRCSRAWGTSVWRTPSFWVVTSSIRIS